MAISGVLVITAICWSVRKLVTCRKITPANVQRTASLSTSAPHFPNIRQYRLANSSEFNFIHVCVICHNVCAHELEIIVIATI